MSEPKLKPFREKYFAIVSPYGKIRHLCTTREVALSQFALHYAKKKRVALCDEHYREVEKLMKLARWTIRPVWMIVKTRSTRTEAV
jgi:hypothetical protein